jgi:hypothetical protein
VRSYRKWSIAIRKTTLGEPGVLRVGRGGGSPEWTAGKIEAISASRGVVVIVAGIEHQVIPISRARRALVQKVAWVVVDVSCSVIVRRAGRDRAEAMSHFMCEQIGSALGPYGRR